MADDNELTLKDPAAGKKKKLIMIVALAVVLDGNAETEDGATGGKIAGPIAAQVIDAAVDQ